ncbi:MAG: oxidoreductase [Betaproteobacteria bacterium RIFCSPLOWO2_12_FULL_62_13]|nr:MAG: oxidoreductase [Betaproteobacteria bacterium RIFCSPLOWO2_12_FULL_62_13]
MEVKNYMSRNRLEGKVAFITGAGAGIAKSAARIFASEGAKVALAEINVDAGRAAEEMVRNCGGDAFFIETDVTREDSVKDAIARTVQRFGRLDVLYNCAGGSLPEDSFVTDVGLDIWNRTIALNVLGTILCCRHGIPQLINDGGGAVVNMSSGAALRGSSPAHTYTAAKGAILSLTRAMAGAYAKHGVRVNAICAGRIMTERIVSTYGTSEQAGSVVDRQDASGRLKEYPFWVGQPEDIANIALFLASDESRMITGAAIPADGGRSAY